jgi:plastocyanin
MRMLLAAITMGAMACGGSGSANAAADQAIPAAGDASSPARATGTVHEVEMLLTSGGDYVFRPAHLTVNVGDRVQWINVSGGPHNVAFYPERIPAGAKEYLNAAMANRMGNLTGPLLIQSRAVYEIAFDGAPLGAYDYFCTPHEMLGMKARLTVTE